MIGGVRGTAEAIHLGYLVDPDPHAVSLNGLPPGEPVFRQVALGTAEETAVSVPASFPRACDPAGLYRVVMEADTDGDGVMETVSCTPIASVVVSPARSIGSA